jgi:hypothetical protein
MAKKEGKGGGWYWPKIGNLADAIEASDRGFWAAVVVASITAVFATIALITKSDVASINAYAYVDAVLFGIIAWRIKRRSKFFAVAGLCLFLIEKFFQFYLTPELASFGIFMAIIITLLFIGGIRGTFAFHRLSGLAAPPLVARDV